jgi:hypothetical protein
MGAHSDVPPYIAAKIQSHEDELDAIWPNWRQKARFDHVDYQLKARIKWLLKRLALLTSRDEHGNPAPKDWDVLVVKDRRNPSQCYAHPVIPATGENDDSSREPASPLLGMSS